MPQILVLCVLILISISAQAVDVEKIKEQNKLITTGCIDFKKMSKNDLSQAVKLSGSISNYLKAKPLSQKDEDRGIETSLKSVAVDQTHILVVMGYRPALVTKAGDSLRSETREVLSQHLLTWHKAQAKKNNQQLTLRFDDECYVPDRCNDYLYGASLMGKLNRLGCK